MDKTPLEPADVLIEGGTVVTMDDALTVIADGSVAVRGRDIVGVGPRAALAGRFTARLTLDAAGKVVLPGLVNGHTHAAMTLFRGMADDMALETWLEQHIWPAEGAFVTPETAEAGVTLACVEMLRGGVTTAHDMYWYPEATARGARRTGLRMVLGGVMVDFPGPDGSTPAGRLEDARALLQRYAADPLLSVSVQPHSTYTVAPEHLQSAKALADEHGALFALHAAETAAETELVRSRYGKTPARHLAALGLLGPATTLHHGVHFDDEEIALLAGTGTSVVHCLESELKLASGIPRTPELLSAGVTVGLGTDGTASNNDLDLWAEIRLAALLFKAKGGDPALLPARQAVWLATRGSAKALGMDALVGSLEPGKRADVVVVDFDRPHLTPVYDVFSHLAYAVNKADVETVLVNGALVVRDGRVISCDEREAMAQVREVAVRIAAADRARLLPNGRV